MSTAKILGGLAIVATVAAVAGMQNSPAANGPAPNAKVEPNAAPARKGPAPILDFATDPYTRKEYADYFRKWGAAGVAQMNSIRIAAARRVAQQADCDQVEMADINLEETKEKKTFVVLVQCSNGLRYTLTKNDLTGAIKNEKQKMDGYDRSAMLQACDEAARAHTTHPMTYSRDFWSLSMRQAPVSANTVIDFDFTARNGFGNEMPGHARCVINPEGNLDIKVVEG